MESLLEEIAGAGLPDLSADTSNIQWCEQCHLLRQEVQHLKDDQTHNFSKLKQKIISTDLLIKKYKAKCDDYDNQSKRLEETIKRLEKFQRQTEVLEAQLKTALLDTEPLKKSSQKLEIDNRLKAAEIQNLKDQMLAANSMMRQYQALSKTSNDEAEKLGQEKAELQKKVSHFESRKASAGHDKEVTKELRGEVNSLKKENIKLQKNEKRLETKLQDTLGKMEMYFSMLKENRMLPGQKPRTILSPNRGNLIRSPGSLFRGRSPGRSPGRPPGARKLNRSPRRPRRVSQRENVLDVDDNFFENVMKQTVDDDESSSSDDEDSLDSVPWTFSPLVRCLSPLPPSPAFSPLRKVSSDTVEEMDIDSEDASDMASDLEHQLMDDVLTSSKDEICDKTTKSLRDEEPMWKDENVRQIVQETDNKTGIIEENSNERLYKSSGRVACSKVIEACVDASHSSLGGDRTHQTDQTTQSEKPAEHDHDKSQYSMSVKDKLKSAIEILSPKSDRKTKSAIFLKGANLETVKSPDSKERTHPATNANTQEESAKTVGSNSKENLVRIGETTSHKHSPRGRLKSLNLCASSKESPSAMPISTRVLKDDNENTSVTVTSEKNGSDDESAYLSRCNTTEFCPMLTDGDLLRSPVEPGEDGMVSPIHDPVTEPVDKSESAILVDSMIANLGTAFMFNVTCKNTQEDYANSIAPDQPAHPRSLIRTYDVHSDIDVQDKLKTEIDEKSGYKTVIDNVDNKGESNSIDVDEKDKQIKKHLLRRQKALGVTGSTDTIIDEANESLADNVKSISPATKRLTRSKSLSSAIAETNKDNTTIKNEDIEKACDTNKLSGTVDTRSPRRRRRTISSIGVINIEPTDSTPAKRLLRSSSKYTSDLDEVAKLVSDICSAIEDKQQTVAKSEGATSVNMSEVKHEQLIETSVKDEKFVENSKFDVSSNKTDHMECTSKKTEDDNVICNERTIIDEAGDRITTDDKHTVTSEVKFEGTQPTVSFTGDQSDVVTKGLTISESVSISSAHIDKTIPVLDTEIENEINSKETPSRQVSLGFEVKSPHSEIKFKTGSLDELKGNKTAEEMCLATTLDRKLVSRRSPCDTILEVKDEDDTNGSEIETQAKTLEQTEAAVDSKKQLEESNIILGIDDLFCSNETESSEITSLENEPVNNLSKDKTQCGKKCNEENRDKIQDVNKHVELVETTKQKVEHDKTSTILQSDTGICVSESEQLNETTRASHSSVNSLRKAITNKLLMNQSGCFTQPDHLGLSSPSLSQEIESLTVSSTTSLAIVSMDTRISPDFLACFSRSTTPSNSSDRLTPVSPLPISPFDFIIPISPLPPSPVPDKEPLSPLPASPNIDLPEDPSEDLKPKKRSKGKGKGKKSAKKPVIGTPESVKFKSEHFEMSPLPALLSPIRTPKASHGKHGKPKKKSVKSFTIPASASHELQELLESRSEETPKIFSSDIPSGIMAIKPKPVSGKPLKFDTGKDETAHNIHISQTVNVPVGDISDISTKKVAQIDLKVLKGNNKKHSAKPLQSNENTKPFLNALKKSESVQTAFLKSNVIESSKTSTETETSTKTNGEGSVISGEQPAMCDNIVAAKAKTRLAHQPKAHPHPSKSQPVQIIEPPPNLVRKRKSLTELGPGMPDKKPCKEHVFKRRCKSGSKAAHGESLKMQNFLKSSDATDMFVTKATEGHEGETVGQDLVRLCIECISRIKADVLDDVHTSCESGDYLNVLEDWPFMFDVERKAVELFEYVLGQTDLNVTREKLMKEVWDGIFSRELPTNMAGKKGLARVFTALCQLKGEVEQPRVLLYHITTCGYLSLSSFLIPVACVWPEVLLKHEVPQGMVLAMEYTMMKTLTEQDHIQGRQIQLCLERFCSWDTKTGTATDILKALVLNLQNATNNDTENPAPVFETIKSVEVMARCEGWAWFHEQFVNRLCLQSVKNRWDINGARGGVASQYVCAVMKITSTVVTLLTPPVKDVQNILRCWFLPILRKEPSCADVRNSCLESILEMSAQCPKVLSNIRGWYFEFKGRIPQRIVSRMETLRRLYMDKFHISCEPMRQKQLVTKARFQKKKKFRKRKEDARQEDETGI